MGNHIGYCLIPGSVGLCQTINSHKSGEPLLSAVFGLPHITRGLYVDLGQGDDTLATWTKRYHLINLIQGLMQHLKDFYSLRFIQLRYTLGFHHVPYQEVFSIMPTLGNNFELWPANFFERNPVLKDKPPQAVK
ncbi:Copper amine oxidase [Trema orientale]|uniref:Amine oxidase n=1 Tax=Trema orientale TaxID=63057 RepID=A0A2P5FWP4_TREOI|nr:Copper amine oxidase [Trema orientale]